MTLNFMTKWPGTTIPTHFPAKILKSFLGIEHDGISDSIYDYGIHIGAMYDYESLEYVEYQLPKIHTIRKGNRWKPGVKIHFKIWTGKPYKSKTFEFAPIVDCVSVQNIIIIKANNPEYGSVYVDNMTLNPHQIRQLAINDGFDNVSDFFRYFDDYFDGQIIHWTDFKY